MILMAFRHPGEQPAILDRDLFDAVQAKLKAQRNSHTVAGRDQVSILPLFTPPPWAA